MSLFHRVLCPYGDICTDPGCNGTNRCFLRDQAWKPKLSPEHQKVLDDFADTLDDEPAVTPPHKE